MQPLRWPARCCLICVGSHVQKLSHHAVGVQLRLREQYNIPLLTVSRRFIGAKHSLWVLFKVITPMCFPWGNPRIAKEARRKSTQSSQETTVAVLGLAAGTCPPAGDSITLFISYTVIFTSMTAPLLDHSILNVRDPAI
jgi:hypothetical protein